MHAGVCDARLLESYAAERDAHARDLVEWAVAVGKQNHYLTPTPLRLVCGELSR